MFLEHLFTLKPFSTRYTVLLYIWNVDRLARQTATKIKRRTTARQTAKKAFSLLQVREEAKSTRSDLRETSIFPVGCISGHEPLLLAICRSTKSRQCAVLELANMISLLERYSDKLAEGESRLDRAWVCGGAQ